MKKWLLFLLALLLPTLALAEGADWLTYPSVMRPGKAGGFFFTVPEDGTADIAVIHGGGVQVLAEGMAVQAGENVIYWDGCDQAGDLIPAGEYTLRLIYQGENVEDTFLMGDPAPRIFSLMADDVLDQGWNAWVECSMPGKLTLRLNTPEGEKLLASWPAQEGDNEIHWDGLVDGQTLPGGEWELILALLDDTGIGSVPEILPLEVYVPSLATDVTFHTPNENSPVKCDHDFCFWQMNMGEMDESAIWEVLTQPVTVLSGKQRQQVKVRREPSDDCKDYVAEVTCDSQAVHILDRGGEWTLIEGYSSCESGSAVKVWALPFQGYVKTELLQEKQVDQQYGLVIDKLQQRLYVFKEGKLFSTLLCSTGFPTKEDPFNETPAGEFLMVSWTGGFWAGNLYCDMGMRINGGILVHEVPCQIILEEDGSERKDFSRCERYLGEKASHGCIRVQRKKTPEGVNIKWLWDHLNRSR